MKATIVRKAKRQRGATLRLARLGVVMALAGCALSSSAGAASPDVLDRLDVPRVDREDRTVTYVLAAVPVAAITEVTTTKTKVVGCGLFFHARTSTLGDGAWRRHRFIWTVTSAPSGWSQTCVCPISGRTIDLEGGEGHYEGSELCIAADVAGTYNVQLKVIDEDGDESTDTDSAVVAADSGGNAYTHWYFDATDGDDANDGLTASTPKQTGGALETAIAGTDDVWVHVADGTYDITSMGFGSNVVIEGSGTAIFQNTSGGRVIYQDSCENVTLIGITLDTNDTTESAITMRNSFTVEAFVCLRCVSATGNGGFLTSQTGSGTSLQHGIAIINSDINQVHESLQTVGLFGDGTDIILFGSDFGQSNSEVVLRTAGGSGGAGSHTNQTTGLTMIGCTFNQNSANAKSNVRFQSVAYCSMFSCKAVGGNIGAGGDTGASIHVRLYCCWMSNNEDASSSTQSFECGPGGSVTQQGDDLGAYSCIMAQFNNATAKNPVVKFDGPFEWEVEFCTVYLDTDEGFMNHPTAGEANSPVQKFRYNVFAPSSTADPSYAMWLANPGGPSTMTMVDNHWPDDGDYTWPGLVGRMFFYDNAVKTAAQYKVDFPNDTVVDVSTPEVASPNGGQPCAVVANVGTTTRQPYAYHDIMGKARPATTYKGANSSDFVEGSTRQSSSLTGAMRLGVA